MRKQKQREKRSDFMDVAAQEREKMRAEAEAEAQLDAMLRRLLEDDAKTRLANVALANRELYLRAVQMIMGLYRSGQAEGKLSDSQLREILTKVSEKREISIRRK